MGLKTIALLFVFGTTIASGQYMPRLLRPTPYDLSLMPYLRSNGCPSAPELAPVICQFMEPNMGLFKPQLIAPSTYIPPLVVEKCDTPQLEIQLPPRKPIVIPEAPILPPITIPKFPVPVIEPVPPMAIMEPIPPVSIAEPYEPAPIAVLNSGDVMLADLSIPAAPVLPPLEMPVLPEIVELHGSGMTEVGVAGIDDQSLMIHQPLAPPASPLLAMPEFPMLTPCPEDGPIPVPMPVPIPAPIPEFFQPLGPMPAPPELPPARLPEIPIPVAFPLHPIAPSMIIAHEEPCITGEIVPPEPFVVAQPPKFPPLTIIEHGDYYTNGEMLYPGPLPQAPMPIVPAYESAVIPADPCEPNIQPVIKSGLPPHYTLPSYMPGPVMGPALYPASRRLNKHVAFAPLPGYMRQI